MECTDDTRRNIPALVVRDQRSEATTKVGNLDALQDRVLWKNQLKFDTPVLLKSTIKWRWETLSSKEDSSSSS